MRVTTACLELRLRTRLIWLLTKELSVQLAPTANKAVHFLHLVLLGDTARLLAILSSQTARNVMLENTATSLV